jgi:hypothetical protein
MRPLGVWTAGATSPTSGPGDGRIRHSAHETVAAMLTRGGGAPQTPGLVWAHPGRWAVQRNGVHRSPKCPRHHSRLPRCFCATARPPLGFLPWWFWAVFRALFGQVQAGFMSRRWSWRCSGFWALGVGCIRAYSAVLVFSLSVFGIVLGVRGKDSPGSRVQRSRGIVLQRCSSALLRAARVLAVWVLVLLVVIGAAAWLGVGSPPTIATYPAATLWGGLCGAATGAAGIRHFERLGLVRTRHPPSPVAVVEFGASGPRRDPRVCIGWGGMQDRHAGQCMSSSRRSLSGGLASGGCVWAARTPRPSSPAGRIILGSKLRGGGCVSC